MINLTNIEKAYMAGFLDGDGSIMAQLVKSDNYKYGFTIRTSIVFCQKSEKHWFLMYLKEKLKYGSLRKRKDGMSEYTITSSAPTKDILENLVDLLIIKKSLANLVLKIIEDKKKIKDIDSFIEVCRLVDKTKSMTYSKKRKITTADVITHLDSIKLND